jgi:hypothetical protein
MEHQWMRDWLLSLRRHCGPPASAYAWYRAPSTDRGGRWHGSSRLDLGKQNNLLNFVLPHIWASRTARCISPICLVLVYHAGVQKQNEIDRWQAFFYICSLWNYWSDMKASISWLLRHTISPSMLLFLLKKGREAERKLPAPASSSQT